MKYTVNIGGKDLEDIIKEHIAKEGFPIPEGATVEVNYSKGEFNVAIDTKPNKVKRTPATTQAVGANAVAKGSAVLKSLPGKEKDVSKYAEDTAPIERKPIARKAAVKAPVQEKTEEEVLEVPEKTVASKKDMFKKDVAPDEEAPVDVTPEVEVEKVAPVIEEEDDLLEEEEEEVAALSARAIFNEDEEEE